jgi:hypothetical protein
MLGARSAALNLAGLRAQHVIHFAADAGRGEREKKRLPVVAYQRHLTGFAGILLVWRGAVNV